MLSTFDYTVLKLSPDSMMENQLILEYIANTVTDWRTVMAHQVLTPRLREHLQSAILIYCETANQQTLDLSESVDNLEKVRVGVEDHWSQILGQLSITARVYEQKTVFEVFLRGKLLEDYRRVPYVIDAKIVWLGRCKGSLEDRIRAAHEIGTQLDQLHDIYRRRVTFILEELMFNQAHVESKMRAAVTRGGKPGSDVQPLIDRCEWANLAAVLVKDQMLTTQIFGKGDDTGGKVLNGISRIQKRYFRELINPSRFVISKYASTLSIKSASGIEGALHHFATAPPPYSDLDPRDEPFCHGLEMKGREKSPEMTSRKSDEQYQPNDSACSSSTSS